MIIVNISSIIFNDGDEECADNKHVDSVKYGSQHIFKMMRIR